MRWCLWVYLAACGSVPTNKPADAPQGKDDAAIDAAGSSSGSPCDVTKSFGTPMSLPGIDGSGDQTWGWFSPDELTIYYVAEVPGKAISNVYAAQRASIGDAFGSGTRLAGVMSDTEDTSTPKVTADGLTLFVTADTASGSDRIFVATRSTAVADFGTPSLVAAINSTGADDSDPWINADATVMYLASVRTGSVMFDLYTATRSSPTGTFTTPVPITELESGDVDDVPVASADGLEIFFASNRSTTSNGRNDIYHATRATTSDPFSAISKVSELSTDTSEEFPTWLSPDRCTLMYSSDAAGGSGGYDIWIATRPQ